MNNALTDENEAVRWCRAVGVPEYHASHLIAHFKEIEAKDADALVAWRAEQLAQLAEHPQFRLTESQRIKVTNLMIVGGGLPFGQALEASDARHSAWLWHVIATESPKVHIPFVT